jgi:hypothetical protein
LPFLLPNGRTRLAQKGWKHDAAGNAAVQAKGVA